MFELPMIFNKNLSQFRKTKVTIVPMRPDEG